MRKRTEEIISNASRLVSSELEKIFVEANFDGLLNPALHLVRASGKLIRPTLVVLAYKGFKGKRERVAAKIAALVECLHVFSLIHDDIIDQSEKRRGVPTVHLRFGTDVAILTGDDLTQVIYKVISEDKALDADKRIRLVKEFANCCMKMIEGEFLDVESERISDITEDDYMRQARGKTGSLLEHSMRIGSILAGASEKAISIAGEFGSLLGCAFQIRDDILDIMESASGFGKPKGQDIREGKKSFIIIHALNHASREDRNRILAFLGKRELTDKEIEEIAALFDKYGSIQYGDSVARDLVGGAKKLLETIIVGDYGIALQDLADMIVNRTT